MERATVEAKLQIERPMRNWKLTLAYDGTGFRGWQVQPNQLTVQGELQAALKRITGEAPLPQGSGRTDAGVHALAQVASFALAAPIPAQSLLRALNRTLPASIRILEARLMPSGFHARHSARAKTYLYRVYQGRVDQGRVYQGRVYQGRVDQDRVCPPFLAPYVYACPWRLDLEALNRSAKMFIGRHDFLSFAATDPDKTTRKSLFALDKRATGGSAWVGTAMADFEPSACETSPVMAQQDATTIRSLSVSEWAYQASDQAPNQTPSLDPSMRDDPELCGDPLLRQSEPLLVYRVRGDGFLHHMVRNLVGTMLDMGRSQRSPDDVPAILAARNRSAAGPTAPARGLFLHSVEYDACETVGDSAQGSDSAQGR